MNNVQWKVNNGSKYMNARNLSSTKLFNFSAQGISLYNLEIGFFYEKKMHSLTDEWSRQ